MSTPPDLDAGATILTFTPGARLFDRYVLQRLLGSGRKGDVWLARDDKLGMEVAIKLLKNYPHFQELRAQIGRLMDLTHQSILRVFDFVGDEKLAGFVMEYFESKPLSALLAEKSGRPFETTEIQRWARDLYAALEFANSKGGLVHKDLRLANLLISPQGQLKVAEFGLAPSRVFGGEEKAPTDTEFVSLPGLSPQVIAGETPVHQDDLYAAAACMYELLTSKPVFPGGNIVLQIQKKVPPKIAERRAELGIKGDAVPKAWEQWIAQSLEKEREKRPVSASVIVEQLQSGTSTHTKHGTARQTLAGTVGQALGGLRDSDHSWIGHILKAAAVLGLLAGAFWYFWMVPAEEKLAERRQIVATLDAEDTDAAGKTADAALADKMQKAWGRYITDYQFDQIAFTNDEVVFLAHAKERQAFWKDQKETIELEARQIKQRQLDLADELDRAVRRESETDKDVDSPTATAISRAAAIPDRVEAWQRLVTKFDKEDAPQIDDYQDPLAKARRTLAGWQAKAKDLEESTARWLTEKQQAFEGLNAFMALQDKGAQVKIKRLAEFNESLIKNTPPGVSTKVSEYRAAADAMKTQLGKEEERERAAPALKTVAELFTGTPLEGKDEKVQKEALKQLQTELKNDGCLAEEPKGEYNEATHAALKAWQSKRDLPADGRLSAASWSATSLGKLDVTAIETQLADMAKKAEEEAAKMAAAAPKKTSSYSRKKSPPKEEPGFWRKVGNTITSPFKKDDPKKKK
ncbi:MAG: protein kinase [Verrucomicrobiaceae bacterium]|nr:protein kinase [Verrucomicrobiaceae bacterium]